MISMLLEGKTVFFSGIKPGALLCIVIAVLDGIEISHKLFTPEMQ